MASTIRAIDTHAGEHHTNHRRTVARSRRFHSHVYGGAHPVTTRALAQTNLYAPVELQVRTARSQQYHSRRQAVVVRCRVHEERAVLVEPLRQRPRKTRRQMLYHYHGSGQVCGQIGQHLSQRARPAGRSTDDD